MSVPPNALNTKNNKNNIDARKSDAILLLFILFRLCPDVARFLHNLLAEH